MKQYPAPSTLKDYAQCPRFVPQQSSDNLASLEGTMLHEKLEILAHALVEQWEDIIESFTDLSSAQLAIVREVAEMVQPYFIMGRPVLASKTELASWIGDNPNKEFIAPECRISPFPGRRGYIDLLIRDTPNHAVIIDYKFGRNDADFSFQMSPYVLEVFEQIPEVESITCKILAPRIEATQDPEEYGRADIPRLSAAIKVIVDAMQDPFTPGCPGNACLRCAGNGRCVWQSTTLSSVVVPDVREGVSIPAPPPARVLMKPNSAQERADRRSFVNWLASYVDYVKEDDKEVIRSLIEAGAPSDQVLPGYTVTLQRGRPILDYNRLEELNRSISLTFNVDFETMLSCLEPVWGKLVDLLTVPGMTQPNSDGTIPSREAIEKAVSAIKARYEVPGAPFPVVRKAGGRRALGGRSVQQIANDSV